MSVRPPKWILAVTSLLVGAATAGALIATSPARDRANPAPASEARIGGDHAPRITSDATREAVEDAGRRDARQRRGARQRIRARIRWRDSAAIGVPEAGRLARGVRLPAAGPGFFTWDPILKRRPNRDWRRWGTDDLVGTVLAVLRRFRDRFPDAPRIGIGDLSLRRGGDFGPEVSGGIGHATHQNGLDVDVYYPRLDRAERAPTSVDQIDRGLSQALVDLFVDAGAVVIYVGPNTGLGGPPEIVQPLANHDNHLHARIAARA